MFFTAYVERQKSKIRQRALTGKANANREQCINERERIFAELASLNSLLKGRTAVFRRNV